MIKVFDAHIHYFPGKREDIMQILSTSPYKDKYFAYNSVNLDMLDLDTYWSRLSGAFIIPFFLKETDIQEANTSLFDYTRRLSTSFYPIPLIDEGTDCLQFLDMSIGAKEHFIKHNAFACERRAVAYHFLDEHGKFLLLHCGDVVRDAYVEYLLQRYSKMRIILAHLGANRRDNFLTQNTIKRFSSEQRVYFDTSTILDSSILAYACSIIPNERLFWGSDTPFVLRDDPIADSIECIKGLNISDADIKDILYNNAHRFIQSILK